MPPLDCSSFSATRFEETIEVFSTKPPAKQSLIASPPHISHIHLEALLSLKLCSPHSYSLSTSVLFASSLLLSLVGYELYNFEWWLCPFLLDCRRCWCLWDLKKMYWHVQFVHAPSCCPSSRSLSPRASRQSHTHMVLKSPQHLLLPVRPLPHQITILIFLSSIPGFLFLKFLWHIQNLACSLWSSVALDLHWVLGQADLPQIELVDTLAKSGAVLSQAVPCQLALATAKVRCILYTKFFSQALPCQIPLNFSSGTGFQPCPLSTVSTVVIIAR